jgi:hypothetical protein
MRLQLFVDNVITQIDTRDPELLGRWLLEQFALIRWYPSTFVRAQAWPSWSDFDKSGNARPDWLTDSAHYRRWEVKTPEDVLAGLAALLSEARGEAAGSA